MGLQFGTSSKGVYQNLALGCHERLGLNSIWKPTKLGCCQYFPFLQTTEQKLPPPRDNVAGLTPGTGMLFYFLLVQGDLRLCSFSRDPHWSRKDCGIGQLSNEVINLRSSTLTLWGSQHLIWVSSQPHPSSPLCMLSHSWTACHFMVQEPVVTLKPQDFIKGAEGPRVGRVPLCMF